MELPFSEALREPHGSATRGIGKTSRIPGMISYGAKLTGAAADNEGLILADLEEKMIPHNPKTLYVVSAFSNPTGKPYAVESRKAIVGLAQKYNVMILEDNPYSRLRISGEALPPLKSFDRKNNGVIYISSFSKVISPASGWVTPSVCRKLFAV